MNTIDESGMRQAFIISFSWMLHLTVVTLNAKSRFYRLNWPFFLKGDIFLWPHAQDGKLKRRTAVF